MEAGLYDPPIVAMRVNSDIIRWNWQGGRTIKSKIPAAPSDKYVGLVVFDNYRQTAGDVSRWRSLAHAGGVEQRTGSALLGP
jgi:hypothetical protein